LPSPSIQVTQATVVSHINPPPETAPTGQVLATDIAWIDVPTMNSIRNSEVAVQQPAHPVTAIVPPSIVVATAVDGNGTTAAGKRRGKKKAESRKTLACAICFAHKVKCDG
jgi:hypothetical protein